jgi:hypothetical protein
MSDDKRKTEPPLKFDMGFDEAFGRFMQTKPEEVDDSIERSKTKKPPLGASQRRSGPKADK